jgi:hypothetical protein
MTELFSCPALKAEIRHFDSVNYFGPEWREWLENGTSLFVGF